MHLRISMQLNYVGTQCSAIIMILINYRLIAELFLIIDLRLMSSALILISWNFYDRLSVCDTP